MYILLQNLNYVYSLGLIPVLSFEEMLGINVSVLLSAVV